MLALENRRLGAILYIVETCLLVKLARQRLVPALQTAYGALSRILIYCPRPFQREAIL